MYAWVLLHKLMIWTICLSGHNKFHRFTWSARRMLLHRKASFQQPSVWNISKSSHCVSLITILSVCCFVLFSCCFVGKNGVYCVSVRCVYHLARLPWGEWWACIICWSRKAILNCTELLAHTEMASKRIETDWNEANEESDTCFVNCTTYMISFHVLCVCMAVRLSIQWRRCVCIIF